MSEPQLAQPGAGLPFPERLIARCMLAMKVFTGKSETFTAEFKCERAIIRSLVRDQDPGFLAKRVLIPRPLGLEDSSRDWSVLMTLDHLRIVHQSIAAVIETLANEQVPAGEVSTAAVKPNPAVGPEIIASYEKSCDELLAILTAGGHCKSKVRYPHPWFGPMDTRGWHALAAVHLGIHRRQIGQILLRGGPVRPTWASHSTPES